MTVFLCYRFYERFSKLISGMIFFQIVSGSVFVSTTIYLLYVVSYAVATDADTENVKGENNSYRCTFVHLQSSGNYTIQTFVTIASALASVVAITPLCYYSTVITTELQGIGNTIYGSKWYKLPHKLQKYYFLSIAVAQQPRLFNGYGLVRCSLEMLRKVQRNGGNEWKFQLTE